MKHSKKTSVAITPEAQAALEKLKARPGGFGLSQYISAELVKLAKANGAKEGK